VATAGRCVTGVAMKVTNVSSRISAFFIGILEVGQATEIGKFHILGYRSRRYMVYAV
jgi:hypothetical protein